MADTNTNKAETKTLTQQWPQLASWPRGTGGKPSGKTLAGVVGMGYRQGTNSAFAMACYLTGPTTQATIQAATSSTSAQLNVWRAVGNTGRVGSKAGAASQTKVKVKGKQVTAYRVLLKAAPKPKAKATSKPKPTVQAQSTAQA